MKNLFLICGGQSPEHEISLRSAKNILAVLDRSRFNVRVIGISKSGKWIVLEEENLGEIIEEDGIEIHIKPGNKDCFITSQCTLGAVDIVFPVLHGPNGEDGTIQGLFQLLDIPYVGSGVLGSAISMDKDISKKLLKEKEIKVSDWVLIRKGEHIPPFDEVCRKLGGVVFVKPANMGSSIGVSKVMNAKEWDNAVFEALSFDSKILVEEQIIGRELECSVMGNEHPVASGVGEVRTRGVYSYEEKYSDSSSTEIIIPAPVSEGELSRIKEVAVQTYQCLECSGLSRVDVFLTDKSDVYVNEVNTMPGFTSISMYPKLWGQAGISYPQLMEKLVDLAIMGHP